MRFMDKVFSTFEEDRKNFGVKKSPPMALCGMRIMQHLLQRCGIPVGIDMFAMTKAGKGIIMRDRNNFKLKIGHDIATIGRRGVLYTLLPCDFETLELREGETLGIVGDVPTENATLRCEHHFLVTQDRDDEKQWNVVGMVNSQGDPFLFSKEETESVFLNHSMDFMARRTEMKDKRKRDKAAAKGEEKPLEKSLHFGSPTQSEIPPSEIGWAETEKVLNAPPLPRDFCSEVSLPSARQRDGFMVDLGGKPVSLLCDSY